MSRVSMSWRRKKSNERLILGKSSLDSGVSNGCSVLSFVEILNDIPKEYPRLSLCVLVLPSQLPSFLPYPPSPLLSLFDPPMRGAYDSQGRVGREGKEGTGMGRET